MNYENYEPVITDRDIDRLDDLLNYTGGSTLGFLEKELNRARVVPQWSIPDDVVTMNSLVTFIDDENGKENQVTIVYPYNSKPSVGRISVLAPLGAALLGLKVGQEIEFPLPSGKSRTIRVVSVDFQPQAHGVYAP